MKKAKNPKILYPILSALFAGAGTAGLLLGLPTLWICGLLAANVFLAAGIVLGTEVKTVRRKNPFAQFSEEEPEEEEARMFRVPMLSVLVAIAAALLAGFLARSAVVGLLVLFTWGGFGFPLAMCILYRSDFGEAMQTGLLTSVGLTAVGGAIQIFLSSPGNSFDPKHCFTWIADTLKTNLTTLLTEGKALAQTQTLPGEEGAKWMEAIRGLNPQAMAEELVTTFLSLTPALFAILVLGLLCVIWWSTKKALQKHPTVEVKYMGRPDGFLPGRGLPLIYFVGFLINLLAPAGSVFAIASVNVVYVLSAILMYAGFSLILYAVNTRARSKALRVVFTLVAIFLGLSSCGSWLLMILGLFSAGRDLRGLFGGGSLR